ncbi:unnamed protein product [Caenorhabditis angaria]|uniref:Uncharacterized protein n=1 Tax=Caenorhabditis angaria TaxID=860376 RepID=A0A9P1I3E1_9PELO|nr:unnamed protein product [Caenorhabditis angaria]
MDQPTSEELEKMLYTTSKTENEMHNCGFAINDKHIISFRNGRHSHLKRGDMLQLYNLSDVDVNFKVKVANNSTVYDVMVFEVTEGDIPHFPKERGFPYPGKEYYQVGIDHQRKPLWRKGVITEKKDGYYVGQSNGATGNAGEPLFDTTGQLLGMTIGEQNPHDVADHFRYIVSTDMILGAGDVVIGKTKHVTECEECLRRKRFSSEWEE